MNGLAPVATVGLFLGLLALGFWTTARNARRDRCNILANGRRARASIVALSAPDERRRCNVVFAIDATDGQPSRGVRQRSTATAVARCGLVVGSGVDAWYLPKSPDAAFIPALVAAERLPPGTALPPAPGAGPVFFISFTDPARRASAAVANSFRWFGGADLTILENTVRIVGRRRRPLFTSAAVDRDFSREAITDVEILDNAVRLSIHDEGRVVRIGFWTPDAATAVALQRMLPATRSEGFAPEMAEAASFDATVRALAPTTPVTFALVALNVLAFIYAATQGAGVLNADAEALVRLGSDYTPLTRAGQWWRLLTNTFLHFGILHIALNMWALYANGPLAERIFGGFRYLLIYLCAGLAGSAASLWWHPLVNGAGASGAIFGLFGALLAFFLRRPGGIPASVVKRHQQSVGIFILVTLLNGMRIRGIDNAAHLGGLVGGLAVGLLLARPLERERDPPQAEWRRAAALAAFVAAATVAAYLHSPRTEALLTDLGGVTPSAVLKPTVTTFFDIRLGATRAEVLAEKGAPLRTDHGVSYYKARAADDDGLVEVHFSGSGEATDQVVAILYEGDEPSAPPGLPYVIGRSPAELARDFNPPVWGMNASANAKFLMYATGLTAGIRQGKVHQYGIQSIYVGRASDR